MKEACVLLENISTASGNYMAPLMRDMLNVLLQLMANGNSVRNCAFSILLQYKKKRERKEEKKKKERTEERKKSYFFSPLSSHAGA